MNILNITDTFKMTSLLDFIDGYYRLADNSQSIDLVLKGTEDDDDPTIVQIEAGTIIKLETIADTFFPMKVIINCDNDVAFYISNMFQTGEFIIYDEEDTVEHSGDQPSTLPEVGIEDAGKVLMVSDRGEWVVDFAPAIVGNEGIPPNEQTPSVE